MPRVIREGGCREQCKQGKAQPISFPGDRPGGDYTQQDQHAGRVDDGEEEQRPGRAFADRYSHSIAASFHTASGETQLAAVPLVSNDAVQSPPFERKGVCLATYLSSPPRSD